MSFFDWEDRYSVGIREIDDQHKQLVALLNELYEAMHAGRGKDALGRVLTGLADYTRFHFAAEELLMRTHHYPDYPIHREKHRKMAAKVAELAEAFADGTLFSPVQISNFLKGWLQRHIMGTDRQLGAYLRDRGLR